MKPRFSIMPRMAGLVAILGLFTSVFASETFKPNNGGYGSISLSYTSILGGSFTGDSIARSKTPLFPRDIRLVRSRSTI